MKFLSKHVHYRIVLHASIPAEPLSGRQARPGRYVLFQDGMANVVDPDDIKELLAHPLFGDTFTVVKEDEEAALTARPSTEPEHDISDVEYGHVGKAINPKKSVPMTAEMKKAVTEMATQIAMTILKEERRKGQEDGAKSVAKKTAKTEEAAQNEETVSPSK